MKSKTKRIYLLIFGFMIALSCMLFAVGCNEDAGSGTGVLEILNWGNETITAEAGKMCELPEYQAKDKKGNTYKVMKYAYRKEDNVRVPVVKNRIDVFSTQGYEVHYKAVKGNASAVKKLTVKVSDMTPPSIICSGEKFAEAGVKYFWNGITIKDNTDADIAYTVEPYDENNMIVDYDSDGFVPAKTGYYTLKIKATDTFGNTGETSYKIFARTAKKGNEIERFDDEASVYFAYTLNGKIKNYGKYSPFRLSPSSNGSVCIKSTSQANTNIYVLTRKSYGQMLKINDGVLSASIFLAQAKDTTRNVDFCGKSFTIPTNTWVNLTVSEKDVGSFSIILGRLSVGSEALFTIKNNEELFTLFIDKVVFTEAQPKVGGLKEAYSFGEKVNFTVSSNYKAYLQTDNEIKEVSTNFIIPKAGKYTLVFSAADPLKADYVHTFVYGDPDLHFDADVLWFAPLDNQLPKVYSKGLVVEDVKYYKVDAITGIKRQLTGVFSAENPFFLIAERTVSGKTTFVKKYYNVIKYAVGTLFDFDDASFSRTVTGAEASCKEEFNGEKGCLVLNVPANTSGLIACKNWIPVFGRAYYQYGGFTHLKIRMYVSNPGALDMTFYATDSTGAVISEADYKLFASASHSGEETGWYDVTLPIDGFMKYFTNFTSSCNFWTTAKADVIVAFDSVVAIKM